MDPQELALLLETLLSSCFCHYYGFLRAWQAPQPLIPISEVRGLPPMALGTTRRHLTRFLTMSSSLGGGADSCLLPQQGCSRRRAGTREMRRCCKPHWVRNCLAGLDPGFCHHLFLIALPFLHQPRGPAHSPWAPLRHDLCLLLHLSLCIWYLTAQHT